MYIDNSRIHLSGASLILLYHKLTAPIHLSIATARPRGNARLVNHRAQIP